MQRNTSIRSGVRRHVVGVITAFGVAALLAGACGKNSPTSPSGSSGSGGSGCQVITGVTTTTFPAAGGTASISVDAAASCTWTAKSNQAFLTISSGSSGSGQGVVQFAVAANAGPQRVATLTITGTDILITQLSPTP